MDKYRLLLRLAKLWLKIIWIFGVLFIGGLYAMFVLVDDPNFFVTNAYSSMAMIICGAFTGFAVMAPKMMSNPQMKNPRGDFMLSLLPMSLFQKYVIILLLTLFMCISTILMSLPIEMIGSVLTSIYTPDRQIEIGGVVRSFVQNGIFPLLLAEMSAGIFTGLLFRKIIGLFVIILPVSFLNSFYFAYGKPMYVPMTESIISIFVTIVFLILGYQVFKRWQIANDGVLMT
jgi:hypothetical protein